MSDKARRVVEKILSRAEVTFGALYAGETTRDKWQCDKWTVRFTKRDGRAAHEETEFFTGLGHRVHTFESKSAAFALRKVNRNSLAWQNEVEKKKKPNPPHAADVLHSLILDASADGQSFGGWCADLGYDEDSRKALSIYLACQENARMLRRIFNREELARLEKALAQY